MKEHLASEILKFVTRSDEIKFFFQNYMHNDVFWTVQWMSCIRHENDSYWSLYAAKDGLLKLITCDVPSSDDFEDQCKVFLDKCFETARHCDVVAHSYDAGMQFCVMNRGTCLEEILIQMDLEVGLEENAECHLHERLESLEILKV